MTHQKKKAFGIQIHVKKHAFVQMLDFRQMSTADVNASIQWFKTNNYNCTFHYSIVTWLK